MYTAKRVQSSLLLSVWRVISLCFLTYSSTQKPQLRMSHLAEDRCIEVSKCHGFHLNSGMISVTVFISDDRTLYNS